MVRIYWVVFTAAVCAAGQSWDQSGNSLLSGAYNFRQVLYETDDLGNVWRARALYGQIHFDGGGNYSINGTIVDPAARVFTASGTYAISATGFGFFKHPVLEGALVYGSVAGGIFVGSSTDSGVNDFFIASRAAGPNNDTFQGGYSISYFSTGSGGPATHYDAFAELQPNGRGAIGNVAMRGNRGVTPFEQTAGGVSYNFTQGVGTIYFPASSAIPGAQLLYISEDGNFVFGGSPAAPDFYVGVRRSTGAPPTFSGLYYFASIYDNLQSLPSLGMLQTSYGALAAVHGDIVGHKRFLTIRNRAALNFSYTDEYPAEPVTQFYNSATSTDYVISADGSVRIGFGRAPFPAINVSVRAPQFSGSGVFLNPAGVVSAASSAPFTAGISPGQVVSLHGQNLSDVTLASSGTNLPASLGGVEVKINGRTAPLYFVSPAMVTAMVPWATTEQFATVQIIKNGTASNAVASLVYDAQPGVFTDPPGGVGTAAVLDSNYALVNNNNPARPGQVIAVFLTGLGEIAPPLADGTASRIGSLHRTTRSVTALIDTQPAEVLYAGLAPGIPGLYQLNVRIPAGARNGNVHLDIAAGRSYSAQVRIPVRR